MNGDRIPPSEMLIVDDVANHFGVSGQSVRNLVRSGQLAAVRVGKLYRIAPDDVDAFVRPASGGAR